MRTILTFILILTGTLLPSFAYAHTGLGSSGFLHGLSHPFSGLDHVCAMLAVGVWATQLGGRAIWAVPLTFVGVMALGGALPGLGLALPFVEQGVVLSVLLLGVLIAGAVRLPLWLGSALVGLFALCHGQAHGVEMPSFASGMTYAAGFVLATAGLHLLGIVFAASMRGLVQERIVRAAGTGIALLGVWLAVA